jgi:hypothetical protein
MRVGVCAHIIDKGLVNLDRVDRIAVDVAERRIPRAEIVERHSHTQATHGGKLGRNVTRRVQEDPFCDFKLEAVGSKFKFSKNARQIIDEVDVGELGGRGVDAQPELRIGKLPLPFLELRAGLPHHPLIDLTDQSDFLRNRDEVCRRHRTA